jgi:16S rRNA processing protein RimM
MDLLEVGKIINTHGLRGEVKVSAWTDTPDVFEDLKSVYIKRKDEEVLLTLSSVRYQKNNLIVKFKELNDINEAEPLKNSVLYAERSALGPLPEGVYYIADLIGLTVKKENGEIIGTLKDVLQTGANDIYVVERQNMKDMLIPVIDGVVLSVDLGSREVIVRLLDGLEEL